MRLFPSMKLNPITVDLALAQAGVENQVVPTPYAARVRRGVVAKWAELKRRDGEPGGGDGGRP